MCRLRVTKRAHGSRNSEKPMPTKIGRIFSTAPFSIDNDTGAIRIKGATLILRPALLEADLLESDLLRHTESKRSWGSPGWCWDRFLIRFCDPIFENVHLRLDFENGHLGRVSLGWGPQVAPSEWTEERIQDDVDRYRLFLIQEFGAIKVFPYKLSWGTVYAAKDDKSGTAVMGVWYSGFEFRARRQS